jgi:hypothetical protein
MTMDIRDIPREERERFINEEVLAKLPSHQAELVKRTMISEEWRQAESAVRLSELEKEVSGLRGFRAEAERAMRELDSARTKLYAAEQARAAAERVAEKERYARIGAEGEVEELKARIVTAQEEPSRLARLREELSI